MKLSRRATLTAGLALPFVARAQADSIRLGTLTPLTGAGGPYGPLMARAVRAVVDAVNEAGGIAGRRIALTSEDDQTNPDAGVRAARKLIDVDGVSAIIGTWASAVTTAVAPLCWENQRMLFTVSGADSITQLPHRGHIIRTQPNSRLQIARHTTFVMGQGASRIYVLSAQTPFAVSSHEVMEQTARTAGRQVVGHTIYDATKTSFRSEVDAALRARPDHIFLNGYTPDVTIILRELFRAGYDGRKSSPAYAINARLLESLPAEVTEGAITFQPSPDVESPAYAAVQRILGTQDPDTYSCQTYDHANLAVLSMARAGATTGAAMRENVRRISQGDGAKVHDAVAGLRALAAGQQVNYEGASGPCDFTDTGDISDCKFRFEVAERQRFRVLALA